MFRYEGNKRHDPPLTCTYNLPLSSLGIRNSVHTDIYEIYSLVLTMEEYISIGISRNK